MGGADLAHAPELLPLLSDNELGDVQVSEAASLRGLRATYRTRAKILASRDLEPTYPATLPDDVAALADALDAADDQPVRIWSLWLPGGAVFVVFELVNARRIAGVVKSADQRIVAPRTWPP